MADLKRRIIAEFSAKNKAKGEMASFQRDMDSTGQAMKRMAMGALTAVGGLYALKRVFDYTIKAAMKQEDAVFLLEAALKSAGEYTVETMEKFEAFAASIQKATIYGDEEVLALMQLMKSLGVTSNKLEQATRMAIGLAAATGRDVRSMSMYIALAQQGEFTMLRRYIPALRSTTDATEQLRIITEFAARGFEIAEAQAETTSGSISQLMNAVSDLAEVAAEPILEPMAESAGSLKILVEGATKGLGKYVEALEKVGEARRKLGLRPMDFPRIPTPDLEEKFGRREPPPKSRFEALIKAAEKYHEILLQQAKEEADAIKAAAAEHTATMQEHYEKRIVMGGNYQEMQERMARQRIETEIALVTQQMEAENKIRKEAADEAVRIAIEAAEEAAAAEVRIAEEAAQTIEARKDEFIRNFQSVIASGLERSMRDWENWKEHITDMLEEVYWTAIRMAFLEPFAGMLAAGLTGALGAVLGPGIFATATPAAEPVFVSPQGGPALQYGGLVEKTGWAKVHRGEKYSGVDGGGGNLDVHIHNEGTEKLEISEVEEYAISDQRIIDVSMRAAGTHGPYRRSIRQASR